MNTRTFTFAVLAASMLITSCTEDLNVEPVVTDKEGTTTVYEAEYLLAIRTETELQITGVDNATNGGEVISLAGQGIAFSNTFGPMDVKTSMQFEMATGRLGGIMTFIVRESSEQLQLRFEEKNDRRTWYDLSGVCLPASSTITFSDMNFTGSMCIEDIPQDMRALEDGAKASFLIEGSLK